jgi:hypothetical protein
MTGLRLEDFDAYVGETWQVDAGAGTVPLRLDRAQKLARAMRDEGGFRLEWLGPADPVLPQAIYRFSRDGGACEMFIVPVAREASGYRYEAIFN